MTLHAWMRQHTSMRGRLSMLLIGLLVTPIFLTGWMIRNWITEEQGVSLQAAEQTLDTEVTWRLGENVRGLGHSFEASLTDLRARAARLAANPTLSIESVFADLAAKTRPQIVARRSENGSWEPGLPATVVGRLAPIVAAGRSAAGFEALGEGLWQLAYEPGGTGTAVLVARDLSGPGGDVLLAAAPLGVLLDRLITRSDRPVAWSDPSAVPGSPGGASLPDGLFDRVVGADIHGRDVYHESVGEHLLGAVPLRGLAGQPTGLAVLRGSTKDFAPLSPQLVNWHGLGTKLTVLVGGITIVGVLIAFLMGLIAPQWIWADIRESTDRIFHSVERLREIASRNSRALGEQGSVMKTLTTSVDDLETASRSIDETTQVLARSAEQSGRVSHSGNRSVEVAQRSIMDVRDRVTTISTLMEALGERTREIDKILEHVERLNDDTRRVSVNATIKSRKDQMAAARQLALVSRDVRELATQATGLTQDIERRVNEIKTSSDTTLHATREGRAEVERCLETFDELEEAFSRIFRWVEETGESVHDIERSTGSQLSSLDDVTSGVAHLQRRARETEGNFHEIEDAIDELAALGQEMTMHWKVG